MDRISSLPNELIINILNFLPTKSTFVTTTLSRRWENLFKEVNTIDVDGIVPFDEYIPVSLEDEESNQAAFRAFVCKMMDCIKFSNVTRFCVSASPRRDQCFIRKVESWLSALLSHGIQEIYLFFHHTHTDFKVPNTIFTCKTLCVLKLSACDTNLINFPDTVYLPCLKLFDMKEIILEMASVGKFLSGCPLLRDFCLEALPLNGQLSTSAPSLTRLRLINTMRYNSLVLRPRVSIVAPLLQYFHYADYLAQSYHITTSSSLVEAYLDIYGIKDFEDVSVISNSARELIQGVSSVKRLYLSAQCMKLLTCVKMELPTLRNLTVLKLDCYTFLHVALPSLLESSPNLEKLIFPKGLFRYIMKEEDVVRQDYWGRRDEVPSCLKSRLKVIEIQYIHGFAEELRMIEYFLRNSNSLSQITIYRWAAINQRANMRNILRKKLKRIGRRWKKWIHFKYILL